MARWNTFAELGANDVANDDLLPLSDTSAASGSRSKTVSVATVKTLCAPTVAAGAPTGDDDETAGFIVGSLWVNTSGPTLYVAVDVSEGAADWDAL